MTQASPQIGLSVSSSSADVGFDGDPRLWLTLRAPESARALPPEHREWLRAALMDDPRTSLGELLSDIEAERAQLWAIGHWPGYVQALVVTRLIHYDRGCALRIQACGGVGMARWLHLLGQLEQHARNLGCRWVEVQGRRGWGRALTGYAFQCVQLAKEL
jgi:hypothetical protein